MTRILYIDDDFSNRLLVRRVLMAEGIAVDEAENARQGIEMATANPPDLILMDISMPEVDGLTATNQIRKISHIAEIKIIAVTANAMTGDREMILKAGCDGYISKPINVDTFVHEISEFLR